MTRCHFRKTARSLGVTRSVEFCLGMYVLVAAVRVAQRGQGAQTAIARLYYGAKMVIAVEMDIWQLDTLPTMAVMRDLIQTV